ncbi:carbohydrate ABC transporter permease [Halobacterium jilantaiense]|uniref:Glucose/mannose transport system permease protein n=1 Tax=Halobacterium jilantaiense TaxID=355548 RepID=A0A1I0MP65_9EURY|nr:carbohydrate ABC transporter permease [Halobacterium jilantaiense]SEV89814.1 glucose/mannose transport system permease protein [Halobacterium jilantaiense]
MASDSSSGRSWNRIGLYAALLALVAFYLSPLESAVMTAFKSQTGFFQTSPIAPPGPSTFTLAAWGDAFSRLQDGLVNSLLFTIPATVLSATLGSFVAYGLTNTKWRGQSVVLVLLIAGIFIPYQSVLVPLSRFWSIVDLGSLLSWLPPVADRSGLVALAITHTAYGVPITTLLFRAHYQSLDDSMLEAARLDGATIRKIYTRIVLPLSIPMFAVALIYQFTNIWNDLLFALVLIQNPSSDVVTISLTSLQGSMVSQYNLQMAGAFITALPTLLVYIFFGDQFAEGVAGGGA